jgi:hypothetical protein
LVSKNRSVDGQNVLYHYIQKSILKEEQFSKELLKHLVFDLSVWIPENFYRRLPIILPYVVRDNSCRIKKPSGEDEWGSANSNGFLRDDNTLLKGVVRSFPIKSMKISAYDGMRLGKGFVASHIWGKIKIGNSVMISSRHHMLNSFVPNLVWLPVQISKLTDREGAFAQKLLQAISYRIYRGINLPQNILDFWNALPRPKDLPNINVDLKHVNFFAVPDEWLTKRIEGLISEIDAILQIDLLGPDSTCKVKSRRYLPTLRKIPLEQRLELNKWLSRYKSWLQSKA